jgi:hypothetical protein
MIATSVGLIVAMAVGAFTMYTGRGFAGIWNYVDMEEQSRKSLDKMTKEIRQTNKLTDFTTNMLVFQDADFTSLTYRYVPSSRRLYREKGGVTNTMLTECDSLNFSIFQRNTTNGTYDQYPTSLQASNCKVVQVRWTCSRTIAGSKMNTETVQSTKIVIRNQQ